MLLEPTKGLGTRRARVQFLESVQYRLSLCETEAEVNDYCDDITEMLVEDDASHPNQAVSGKELLDEYREQRLEELRFSAAYDCLKPRSE